jgi:hypothetical protein
VRWKFLARWRRSSIEGHNLHLRKNTIGKGMNKGDWKWRRVKHLYNAVGAN